MSDDGRQIADLETLMTGLQTGGFQITVGPNAIGLVVTTETEEDIIGALVSFTDPDGNASTSVNKNGSLVAQARVNSQFNSGSADIGAPVSEDETVPNHIFGIWDENFSQCFFRVDVDGSIHIKSGVTIEDDL